MQQIEASSSSSASNNSNNNTNNNVDAKAVVQVDNAQKALSEEKLKESAQQSAKNISAKKSKKDKSDAGPHPSGAVKMQHVIAIGLSHHTATVEVREKLSIQEANWASAAAELTANYSAVHEAAVLSTCNRFEVYIAASNIQEAIYQVSHFLSQRSGIPIATLRQYLFILTETEAIWHLLRVSAGLDSLVIGEGQILAQVKKCYEIAIQEDGSAGKILSKLLNTSVSAGKRVRSETDIAKGAVSISSAAVELAELHCKQVLTKELKDCQVCILGAGKMSKLLVTHLASRGVSKITIVNRSMERSQELQQAFDNVPMELKLMHEMLDSVDRSDLVFASTGAMEPILFKENLKDLSADKNKMLIDISVPRNIATDVAELEHMRSYNVDDLKAVVAKNQAKRRKQLLEAEVLLREEQRDFLNWHHSLGSVPAITKLQERAETIRVEELEKMNGKLSHLSESERAALEKLTKGIVNKMLHGPMSQLRCTQDVEERARLLKSLEAMFSL